MPRIAATGAVITRPVSITHATTVTGAISRLERDEQSVEMAHATAAPNPPTMAIISAAVRGGLYAAARTWRRRASSSASSSDEKRSSTR
jgi:hypothetical protein